MSEARILMPLAGLKDSGLSLFWAMPKKILVIDDEKDFVEVFSLRLEAEGFEHLTAWSGREGIEKARAEKPDLILLDLMMPGMDGYEVARRLQGDPATSGIPIIVLTAATAAGLEERVSWTGALDCVTKPFEPSELIEKIRKVLL